ncbi:MAG: pyruvate kinase [Nanoarchaeota archaeon]|nr:pyruvate kinase [Nanoarchaeota archaeon]
MRKTKIVCTIGPASESYEMLEKMTKKYGLNVARLNFSHGTHEEHKKRVETIRKLNKDLYVQIAILVDLQGSAIRTGFFDQNVKLIDGEKVIVTPDEIMGSKDKFTIHYPHLPQVLKKGSLIYIADGTIELVVDKIVEKEVFCTINVGGEIGSKKNVNLPNIDVDLPAISEKDMADIMFAIENKVDFIALSFVKTAKDIHKLKDIIKKHNVNIHVVAKIECGQALENLDEITRAADAVMVARGDLGVQIPIEQVPTVQKTIIKKCNSLGKPVITATQMLDSMIKNPRPTRAEVTDVANAIIDGTDAVMLSGETTTGAYPLRSVEMMDKIIRYTEQGLKFKNLAPKDNEIDTNEAIARSVCTTAHEIGASGIITCTLSGFTARHISKYRPDTFIVAVTPNDDEVRKLNLCWGVRPVLIEQPKTTDDLIRYALDAVRGIKLLKKGSRVIITAGIPFHIPGNTNMMMIDIV